MSLSHWILLFALGLLWGSSFVFNEYLLFFLSPIQIIFLRLAIGAIALLAYCLIRQLSLRFSLRDWLIIFGFGLINNTLPFTLISIGQQYATGGLASILNAATALFAVPIAALFIANEPLRSHRALGVMVGFIGVVIAVGIENLSQMRLENLGQLWILVAAICYACATVFARRTLGHIPNQALATGMMVCAAIQITIYSLIAGEITTLTLNTNIILSSLGYGVLSTALAYLLYFHILTNAGASWVLLVTLIVPIFAITLDALFLRQLVSLTEVIGFLVIFFGLILIDGRLTTYLKAKRSRS
ncbi:MAG: DMT family transporter [Pseudomonadota bacterium]